MPRLIRFAIIRVTTGTVLCWLALGALLALDFNGWRSLLSASEMPLLAGAVVAMAAGPFIGVCFFATGLMLLREDEM